MNPSRIGFCALVSFVALTVPCIAQDAAQNNPWNGSWKLDPSSLKYDGPTYTVATDADGYTITRGGKASPKVVCNGQPNAPVDGVVTTCTKTDTGYALVNTRDGKPASKVNIERSADGNTVTRAAEITPPDGSSPFTITTVSKRLSGGTATGDPTTWKEASFSESQDTGVLTVQLHGDSVDFKETDNDKPITCKLDGTPTNVGGQRTMSCRLDNPNTLKVTYSNNGKVARENTFILTQDGQSIQETDVTPAPMPSTMTVVLHKS
jgi:hypothetical protein